MNVRSRLAASASTIAEFDVQHDPYAAYAESNDK